MDQLVIAVLQLPVAVNIFNIETGVKLKPFRITALVRKPLFSGLLKRLVLEGYLFQQVVDGLLPFLVVVEVAHQFIIRSIDLIIPGYIR